MDDLSQTINSVLSDPDAMEQLRAMAEAMGLGTPPQNTPQQSPTPEEFISPGQLTAILSALNQAALPDETCALLASLRPLLGRERQSKLDKAEKALKLMAAAKTVTGTLSSGGDHVQSLF